MQQNTQVHAKLCLLILQGRVKELILTHKDRLLRLGSEIVFKICGFFGGKITSLKDEPDKPAMEQFCTDLVEIMTVFCSKIYGTAATRIEKAQVSAKNRLLLLLLVNPFGAAWHSCCDCPHPLRSAHAFTANLIARY